MKRTNRKNSILFPLFIALCFSTEAIAQDDCNNLPMSYMYSCFADNLKTADKRVSDLYSKMLDAMPEEYRDSLKRSQNTWRAYRDAQCAFLFVADSPRREIPCKLQMAEEREHFLTEEFNEECNGCIPYKK